MTDTNDIIDRYFEAWNEPDPERRTEASRSVWTDDGRYVDPFGDVTGPDAFAAFVEGVRAQYPGLTVRRTTAIDLHHDCARFGWEAVDADGVVTLAGIDVVLLAADRRLRSLTGFIGEPAALAPPEVVGVPA